MTDWADCEVSITGAARDISRLRTRLAHPYESFFPNHRGAPQRRDISGDFLLWNCVRPEPEELLDYWSGTMVVRHSGAWEMQVPYRYQWNLDNWGTKWELDDECAPFLVREGRKVLTYSFSSANEPPLEALRQLSKDFPQVRISTDVDGVSDSWNGNYLIRGGTITRNSYLQSSLWSLEDFQENYG